MSEWWTATGAYRFDLGRDRWVGVNGRRPADNRVLELLPPADQDGLAPDWADVAALSAALPADWRVRLRGNGSVMFSRNHGLGRDFVFAKRYARNRLVAVRSVGLVIAERAS